MPHSELNLWTFIEEQLRQFQSCMLLAVVDHQGSSPGRRGFKMAVSKDFSLWGSIGGGIMEHKLVELAHRQLAEKQKVPSIKKQIHQASVAQDKSGMICSGEQTVVLIPLDSSMLELVQALITGLSNHDEIHIELSPKGLGIVDQTQSGKPYYYQNKDSWCYYEKVGFTDYLHIIGGGHVSLALSELAAALDFHVSVYDDREDLHTIQQNHHAHLIKQVDYQQLPAFPQSDRQYMVVMSFGYRTDAEVLRQLYPGKFSYFGLLGSAAKIKVLFNELEQEGFDKNWFSQIDAPAGVKISSQTPMEIAVSIAANLIKARQRLI